MMLRKDPLSRPGIDRVIKVLSQSLEPSAGQSGADGYRPLQEAAARIAAEVAQREAAARRQDQEAAQRRRTLAAGKASLRNSLTKVAERLLQGAPNLHVSNEELRFALELGGGRLDVNIPVNEVPIPPNSLPRSGWDVVATASVVARQLSPDMRAEGAMLYYVKTPNTHDYRWWEVHFEPNPLRGRPVSRGPYLPDINMADAALKPISGVPYVVRGTPTPIDDENLEETCIRWGLWMANAAAGKL
jgi:hypothetical protein